MPEIQRKTIASTGGVIVLHSRSARLSVLSLSLAFYWCNLSSGPEAHASSNDIAQKVRELFEQRCYQCHGMNGVARKNVFILDRNRLIASQTVIPGDPASPLLKIVQSGTMPPTDLKLSSEEQLLLTNWVTNGAPDWGTPQSRHHITELDLINAVRDDLLKAPERSRQFLRYFSLVNLYNAGVPDTELESHRTALSKLLNSLSWHPDISVPTSINSSRTIFRIDLRDYKWTASSWELVLAAYPYGVRTSEAGLVAQLAGTSLPLVRADWFVANASLPPLYHELLDLPKTVTELERLLGVDVVRDIREERNVIRAGIRTSGVSANNRILERHVSLHGAYWKSFDFRGNSDSENIFRDPLNFNPAGSEVIFNLPNGMQGYFLADSLGRRLDEAPIDIVSDRNNPDDPIIQNGRSCMSCHFDGVRSFKDDVRAVIRADSRSSIDFEKVLALYVDSEQMSSVVERDRQRFLRAAAQAGSSTVTTSNNEPINALWRRFDSELTLNQAAAEAGLTPAEFRERIAQRPRLVSLGYTQLLVRDGGLKRDLWERNFGELVRELRLGEYIAPRSITVRNFGGPGRRWPEPLARVQPQLSTRTLAAGTTGALRSARSLVIISETVFLKPHQLENELRKQPEFASMQLVIVKDPRAADIRVELDRPLFTYTFTFAVIHQETSLQLTAGKVTAFDGNFAAPKIAKELLKRMDAARNEGLAR